LKGSRETNENKALKADMAVGDASKLLSPSAAKQTHKIKDGAV
jgi:hypothetical protein